jgi:putative ABC transport system permease protein
MTSPLRDLFNSLRVGSFLGLRLLKRAGRGTSLLIVLVMALTFLNLTVVSGVLVGLIEGSSRAYRAQYSADLIVSSLPDRVFIQRTRDLLATIRSFPEVTSLTARYLESGTLESDFNRALRPGQTPNRIGAVLAGIEAGDEDATTRLSQRLIDGRYLDPAVPGEILVGSGLLQDYARANVPGETYLQNAHVGDKIRVTIHDRTVEVTVRGILKSKINDVNKRVYFNARELRQMIGRTDLNVDEIAVKLSPLTSPEKVKAALEAAGAGDYALVQTWQESQGTFYKDIGSTFGILGDLIGAVAVAVAAITVFIVIFVSIMNRRRQIGVLKGLGVTGGALVTAYLVQATAYAAAGSVVGLAFLYGLALPWFDAHPIDFPFSDGILAVTTAGTVTRLSVLLAIAAVAGALPARMVVRRNTLDTILGR